MKVNLKKVQTLNSQYFPEIIVLKKIHKSKSRTRTGKKDNKKHIQSFESFGLIKRTESSSQKKKKSNSVGPFIRIEGTKQFPSVVKLFNQTPVDDGDSKSNKTPKTGFVSTPTIQVSNIPSDKSVMLPLNRILSEELWLCALCGKQTSHKSLGDLFGPYYLESHLALVKAKDGGKKDPQVPSWGGGGESKTEPTRSARRRRPSAAQDVTLSPPATRPVEVWVHEDCVLWADGVFLIGSKIYGLEEAVKVASSTVSGNLGNVIFIIKIVPVTDLSFIFYFGICLTLCSSVVRAFAHGAMGCQIDPSRGWTHWAVSHSSLCSTTGVTKAVVCAILSVGWCI